MDMNHTFLWTRELTSPRDAPIPRLHKYNKPRKYAAPPKQATREIQTGVHAASDEDLFISLNNFSKSAKNENNSAPFLISTYNLGTHAFLKGNKTQKNYGIGDNGALNRFHQFDLALGKFLDYFFNSSYSKNTILIVTADHATYPEPPVLKALSAEPRYQKYFIDKIPLLIFSPYHQLPSKYDAQVRTSIDLAPSVLHMLNINHYECSFLGNSIFTQKHENHVAVAAESDVFYKISEDGKIKRLHSSQNLDTKYNNFRDCVSTYYQLELENKIFNK